MGFQTPTRHFTLLGGSATRHTFLPFDVKSKPTLRKRAPASVYTGAVIEDYEDAIRHGYGGESEL